jgi:Pentapeptide repeats (9 copies)
MEIERIELLDLDVVGYGPDAQLTRREWREICFKNFSNRHSTQFTAWLKQSVLPGLNTIKDVEYGYKIFLKNSTKPICISRWFDANFPSTTIDLIGQTIEGSVVLHEIYSAIPIMFDGVDFLSDVLTMKQGLEYPNALTFEFAKFRKRASFPNSTFKLQTSFHGAIFYGDANFENSTFEKSTKFTNVQFYGEARFYWVSFKQDVLFREAAFFKSAKFMSTKFDLCCYFEGAIFTINADFEGGVFKLGGNFEEAKFALAPSFLSVSQQTFLLFSNTNFSVDVSQQAIVRFNYLKLLSESTGQTEQALNFNALELQAKRHSPTEKVAFKCGTWLYEGNPPIFSIKRK